MTLTRLAIVFFLLSCTIQTRAATLPPIRTVDGRFLDAEGREVLLRGVNVISKNAKDRYRSWHEAEDFARLRDWGMNCIRLGILWDGVEPEPGVYDEDYLGYVASRIRLAAEHGLYVFLDMHQDLFSVKYSDGAPAWATLDEGKPHKTGAVWSDAYLVSPAVQTAFDNFWANAPAPGGLGVQEHYARMWAHVAARFKDEPNLIGYDLMNEPFSGSGVQRLPLVILGSPFAGMALERLGEAENGLDLISRWYDPAGRSAITALFGDIAFYRAFVDAQTAFSQAFERERLMPMYQRVADAIRAVDAGRILFLETAYLCNTGVPSGIEPVAGPDGQRDPRQAYAPHGYDIVVDTPDLAESNAARVELIFQRHAETAKRLGMPMLVGEWGAFGGAGEEIRPAVRQVLTQFDRHMNGDTYWEYGKWLPDAAYADLLARPGPDRVAGRLVSIASDPESHTFSCAWEEDPSVSAPGRIYLPEAYWRDRNLRLDPPGAGFALEPAVPGSGNRYVLIAPGETPGLRRFTVE